jgi:hypothetical protein
MTVPLPWIRTGELVAGDDRGARLLRHVQRHLLDVLAAHAYAEDVPCFSFSFERPARPGDRLGVLVLREPYSGCVVEAARCQLVGDDGAPVLLAAVALGTPQAVSRPSVEPWQRAGVLRVGAGEVDELGRLCSGRLIAALDDAALGLRPGSVTRRLVGWQLLDHAGSGDELDLWLRGPWPLIACRAQVGARVIARGELVMSA